MNLTPLLWITNIYWWLLTGWLFWRNDRLKQRLNAIKALAGVSIEYMHPFKGKLYWVGNKLIEARGVIFKGFKVNLANGSVQGCRFLNAPVEAKGQTHIAHSYFKLDAKGTAITIAEGIANLEHCHVKVGSLIPSYSEMTFEVGDDGVS